MAKSTPKRPGADTQRAQAKAFENVALGPIEPPETVKLRKDDRPIWDLIIGARARDEWSVIDLHHAANMTRCFADIERISNEIAAEGDVRTNDRGTMYANPKHVLLETLSRRSVALTRLLHLHASVVVGRPADVAKGRETEANARRAAQDASDDDFLATPGHGTH